MIEIVHWLEQRECRQGSAHTVLSLHSKHKEKIFSDKLNLQFRI